MTVNNVKAIPVFVCKQICACARVHVHTVGKIIIEQANFEDFPNIASIYIFYLLFLWYRKESNIDTSDMVGRVIT